MGKKGNVSDFEHGKIVGAETTDRQGLPMQPSPRFTQDGLKKRKDLRSASSLGENALLMGKGRGKWPDSFQQIG